eukprot:6462547-Amphidinium_carterae.1
MDTRKDLELCKLVKKTFTPWLKEYGREGCLVQSQRAASASVPTEPLPNAHAECSIDSLGLITLMVAACVRKRSHHDRARWAAMFEAVLSSIPVPAVCMGQE